MSLESLLLAMALAGAMMGMAAGAFFIELGLGNKLENTASGEGEDDKVTLEKWAQ